MPRPRLGEAPMSGAERQARQRAKAKAQRDVARDALDFLRWLEPKHDDSLTPEGWHKLRDIQRRIRTLHPI